MILRKCLLTDNDCYRAGRTITPKGVMIHSTGANNPNLRRYVQPDDGKLGSNPNGNHWNRSGVDKCVHAMIGKLADGTVAVYQTLPWNWRGWHAGNGSPSANNTHIAFEICEDGLGDRSYFAQVYQAAVELTAYLCRLYRLDPLQDGVVICHAEGHRRGWASNHGDVEHWFPKMGKSMDDFRADVAKMLGTKPKAEVTVSVDLPVLKKGSRGDSVRALQLLLIGYGYTCGATGADGSFGGATDRAVRAYQRDKQLTVDGSVGGKTWACLLGRA